MLECRQHVYPKLSKWTKEDIQTMMERRNFGEIKEIVLQTDSAVVHFDHWTRPDIAKHFSVGGNMTVDALYGKRMVIDKYNPTK